MAKTRVYISFDFDHDEDLKTLLSEHRAIGRLDWFAAPFGQAGGHTSSSQRSRPSEKRHERVAASLVESGLGI
jgi:hypothetical protein